MKRLLVFIYGVTAYSLAMGSLAYATGFLSNFLVPKIIDGEPAFGVVSSLVINTLLVALFGLQHSLMARDWFKKGMFKIVPPAAERSTYVLFSGLGLIILYHSCPTKVKVKGGV